MTNPDSTSKPIFENDNYKITLGETTTDGKTVTVYDLTNKVTGVLESQASVLPAMLQSAVQWDSFIKEATKIAAGPPRIEVPTLVPPKNPLGRK